MPSSTSNSNQRLQAGKWGRTWLVVVLCVGLMLTGWEYFWRLRGFEPTVTDDANLWGIARRCASGLDPQGLVLVGSSRIQLGLHPGVFEASTGIEPVMLAIDGSSPLPVLQDLADDAEFDSRVIVSMIPLFLAEPARKDRALEWVQAFEKQKWSSRIETRLSIFTQQTFVFRNASLAPDEIWSHWQKGAWPDPPYAPMRPNRYRPGYFSMADVAVLREGRIERVREIHSETAPLSRSAFFERVARINRMVSQIRKRGGAVAFVRFPSEGVVRELEHQDWPRAQYWNVLAERTDAIAIHYEDYPALQGFQLPDASHLDIEDAKRFTRNLAEILAKKGFVSLKERPVSQPSSPSPTTVITRLACPPACPPKF